MAAPWKIGIVGFIVLALRAFSEAVQYETHEHLEPYDSNVPEDIVYGKPKLHHEEFKVRDVKAYNAWRVLFGPESPQTHSQILIENGEHELSGTYFIVGHPNRHDDFGSPLVFGKDARSFSAPERKLFAGMILLGHVDRGSEDKIEALFRANPTPKQWEALQSHSDHPRKYNFPRYQCNEYINFRIKDLRTLGIIKPGEVNEKGSLLANSIGAPPKRHINDKWKYQHRLQDSGEQDSVTERFVRETLHQETIHTKENAAYLQHLEELREEYIKKTLGGSPRKPAHGEGSSKQENTAFTLGPNQRKATSEKGSSEVRNKTSRKRSRSSSHRSW